MIVLLDLLVAVAICLLLLAFWSQLLVPLQRGSVLFPFFRKTQVTEQVAKAQTELEALADEELFKELQDEIQRRKAELNKD